MKTLLLTLLLATFCATCYGQTIKALGYTTNGQIVYTNTNTRTFNNSRIGLLESGEDTVFLVNQSGAFAIRPNDTGVAVFTDSVVTFGKPVEFDNATNAATTRTNLGLGGGVITNIDVLVSGGGTNTLQFSNGILTNVTTP